MKVVGILAALLGLALMSITRRDEGCLAAAFFVLALTLFLFGLYLMFFEDGRGIGRWLPFLSP